MNGIMSLLAWYDHTSGGTGQVTIQQGRLTLDLLS